jgi:hypothetical protein
LMVAAEGPFCDHRAVEPLDIAVGLLPVSA